MSKRPKITVTESNKEFVIPTLKKFGGINNLIYDTIHLDVGDSAIIDVFDKISVYVKGVQINSDKYYELDPKDYVKPSEPQLVVGAKVYPAILETVIGAQKESVEKSIEENQVLKQFATFVITKHPTAFDIMDLPEETKNQIRRMCNVAKEY